MTKVIIIGNPNKSDWCERELLKRLNDSESPIILSVQDLPGTVSREDEMKDAFNEIQKHDHLNKSFINDVEPINKKHKPFYEDLFKGNRRYDNKKGYKK